MIFLYKLGDFKVNQPLIFRSVALPEIATQMKLVGRFEFPPWVSAYFLGGNC